MDIHLLAINVGNSRMAIGTFAAGELRNVTRISLEHRSDWKAAIAQAWGPIAGKGAAVAAASVNAPLIEAVEHAVHEATGQDVQWVGSRLDLPIQNVTDKPEQTGVDRLLNVAAAYEQLGHACVVVDAGTAVTVSCCNDA